MPYHKLRDSAELANTMRESSVLLYFTASWCGPCQELKPILENIAEGVATIVEIDVDDHGDLAEEHNVSGIPLLKLMAEGGTREKWKSVGVVSKDTILHHIA